MAPLPATVARTTTFAAEVGANPVPLVPDPDRWMLWAARIATSPSTHELRQRQPGRRPRRHPRRPSRRQHRHGRRLRPRRLERRAPSGGCATSSSATWRRISWSPAPPPTRWPWRPAVRRTARSSATPKRTSPPTSAARPSSSPAAPSCSACAGAAGKLTPAAVAAMLDTMGRRRARAAAERAVAVAGHRARHASTRPTRSPALAALARGRADCTSTWTARASPTPSSALGATPGRDDLAGRRRRPVVRRHQERRARRRGGDLSSTARSPTTSSTARKRAGQLVSKSRYLGRADARLSRRRPAGWPTPATPTGWPTGWPRRSGASAACACRCRCRPTRCSPSCRATLHERWRARGARYLEWPGEGPGTDAVAGDESVHPPGHVVPDDRGGRAGTGWRRGRVTGGQPPTATALASASEVRQQVGQR